MKAEEYFESGLQRYGNSDFDGAMTDLKKKVDDIALL